MPSVPGKIIIIKLSDSKDYASGHICLNGEKAKLNEFINSDNDVFEQEIYLQGSNKLRVVFRGDIGATLSVEVTQEQPPTGYLESYPNIIVRGESSVLT